MGPVHVGGATDARWEPTFRRLGRYSPTRFGTGFHLMQLRFDDARQILIDVSAVRSDLVKLICFAKVVVLQLFHRPGFLSVQESSQGTLVTARE